MMFKKRKYMVIVTTVVAIALFSSVVYVAASPAWTIDDMVAWMENPGKKWIGRITRWTREIREKMGQGLVGEVDGPTYLDTTGAGWTEFYSYSTPGPSFSHPKKFSFWINLWYMGPAETIEITVSVETDPGITDPYDYQVYIGDVDPNSILVVDQLPLAGTIDIYIEQTAGTPFAIIYHAIIEEV